MEGAKKRSWRGIEEVFFFLFLLRGVDCEFPKVLELKRAFPEAKKEELGQIQARDMARHRRILKNVVDFTVDGTGNPYVAGLYYTTLRIGTPPEEYHVQIDTGSDILWLGCRGCTSCPDNSGLRIKLRLYDDTTSSTSSTISCTDSSCSAALMTQTASCETQSSCNYVFKYGDGSSTTGRLVADTMIFDTVGANNTNSTASAKVVFGCSVSVSGDLTKSDKAVDGILGFGQNSLSVISQLAKSKIAPNSFSHCLIGSESGGGIMVLGEIVEPGIVYTPLVPSQPHYNLNLQSISVNGKKLAIDSSVFATSSSTGTIIDTGTTLAYLADDAYVAFYNAIMSSVSQNSQPISSKGLQCFVTTNSIDTVFPAVSLNFEGATMSLTPDNYLIEQGSVGGAPIYCLGWQRLEGQSMTILGDIVLKDKIVVYDLDGQRVGWRDYDCSKPVNVSVSSSSKTTVSDSGHNSVSGSSLLPTPKLLSCTVFIFILHTVSTLILRR